MQLTVARVSTARHTRPPALRAAHTLSGRAHCGLHLTARGMACARGGRGMRVVEVLAVEKVCWLNGQPAPTGWLAVGLGWG